MEKLTQQLNGLYTTMHKWEAELTEYSTWALANDGVLDNSEKAEIKRLQGEIDAIKRRIEQISEKKSIVLLLPMPTGTTDSETDLEEGNMDDVGIGEFAKVLVAWCGQLEKTLTLINDEYRHVRITEKSKNLLRNDFTSTIPVIQELKKALDAKLPAATTVGELCDLLIGELQKYNSEEKAESHYKAYKKAYKKDKSGVYSILPTAEQVEKTLLNAADKTDPNHPENLKAAEDDRKAEEATFKTLLSDWWDDMVDEINNNLTPLNVISKKTLSQSAALEHLTEDSVCSSLGINKGIVERIYKLIGDKEFLVMDFKKTFVNQIDSFIRVDNARLLFETYSAQLKGEKRFQTIKLPRGFGLWLKDGSKASNAKGFIDKFGEWKSAVESVAAEFCLDLEKMGREDSYHRLDTAKIKDKVGGLFNKTALNSPVKPGTLFWEQLEAKLGGAHCTAAQFNQFWEASMDLLSESEYFSIYETISGAGLSNDDFEGLNKMLNGKILPHAVALRLALFDCEYIPIKLKEEDDFVKKEEIIPIPRKNDTISFTQLVKTPIRILSLVDLNGKVLLTKKILNNQPVLELAKHKLPVGKYSATLDIGTDELKSITAELNVKSSTEPLLCIFQYAGEDEYNNFNFDLDFYPKELLVFVDGTIAKKIDLSTNGKKDEDSYCVLQTNTLCSFYIQFKGEAGDGFTSKELFKTSAKGCNIGWTVTHKKILVSLDVNGVSTNAWIAASPEGDALKQGHTIAVLDGQTRFLIGDGLPALASVYLVVAYMEDGAKANKTFLKVSKQSSHTVWDVSLNITDFVLLNNESGILFELRNTALIEINSWAIFYLEWRFNNAIKEIEKRLDKLEEDTLSADDWISTFFSGASGIVGILGAITYKTATIVNPLAAAITTGVLSILPTVIKGIRGLYSGSKKATVEQHKKNVIEITVLSLKQEYSKKILEDLESSPAKAYLELPENKAKTKAQLVNEFQMELHKAFSQINP